MLNIIKHAGPHGPPPLIIAHGLYGSARNWGVIAKRLCDERTVIAVDMRNHANSFWDDHHSYTDLATDLYDVARSLGDTVDLLGHSMGGKAAMVCALLHQSIRKLIVADIAPVAYTHSQQVMIDAMRSVNLYKVENRADADMALSSMIDDPSVRAFLLQSLNIKEKCWRLNLNTLSNEMDKIVGFPHINAEFSNPTLFLSGANSNYVLPDHRPIIKSHFPKARFAKLPNAGHWLHAENPRGFEDTVRVFLNA